MLIFCSMASRARRILKMIPHTQNVSPNKIMDDEQLEKSSSLDEILSDTENIPIYYDHRLISSRQEDQHVVCISEAVNKNQVSLVPDYDSDDSGNTVHLNTDCNIDTFEVNENLPKSKSSSASSSTSSSSTSSSSSSSSSSDSDSCCISTTERQNQYQDSIPGTSKNTDNIVSTAIAHSSLDISETTTTTHTESCSTIRRQINSPIFTDESEVDLSDDDPSFNYQTFLNKNRKKRNFFFETTNSRTRSMDSDSSSSSDCSERNTHPKGRKRLRNPSKWKQNLTKKLRNTGESYVSQSKTRKTIESRCLKIPCTEGKCKLECTKNIPTDDRYKLFKFFWDLGDLCKQRSYISSCMVDVAPKYKYTNAERPRRPNKAYYFTVDCNKIRVCKTFFKSTLDISDRMIFTVQTKLNDSGFMLEDMRGRHNQHKTLNPELVSDIRKHIQSIPKIESHYIRATTSREYIDGGKNIKDLYNDFVDQQKQNNKECGNYITYYKIFTTKFNLSFFQPKKDQCDLCVSYNNSVDEKKIELEQKYSQHLEEKTLSRIEKQEDRMKITKDNKVAIYDLEAVLQCPRGDSSAFYYKSKLNSYNLTLTELTKASSKTAYDNVHCYFWTESEAKRGAVEIGTCVWKYLEKLSEGDSEEKNIIFYSDNCCGQNKNKFIATLYLFATQNLNIKTITHKFLITGHTQNEADSVHSLIEKEIKKNLKSGPIYSPDQYIALIKNAKKSKPAIQVHELTFDSFIDLKLLQEEWGYNYNTDTQGQTVNWNSIKILEMKKGNPFSIFFKTSYKDTDYREIDIRNKRKKMKSYTQIQLEKAYTGRQNLSVNKKKDLKDLITKGLIPPFYANFYNSII